jgi:hypothetical protein
VPTADELDLIREFEEDEINQKDFRHDKDADGKNYDSDDDENMFGGKESKRKYDDEDKNSEDSEDQEIEFGKRRAMRKVEKKKVEKKAIEDLKIKSENYYRGSYHGKSTAGIAYYLASVLNKDNNLF